MGAPSPMNFSRWVFAAPWLIFGVGVGLCFQSENEVRAQYERAQTQWRIGDYAAAISLYDKVHLLYPSSSYAPRALFELGNLNYINSRDIQRAVENFQMLVDEYPKTPQAVDALLRLGEINEIELQDYPAAIVCWKRVLELDASRRSRRQLLFRIGNAYFKLDQFERAIRAFEELVGDGVADDLTQQANIRLGTIYQINADYLGSLPYFRAVLENESRPNYRLQAQLGLIESFEFLDDLKSAVEVARRIDEADSPAAEMKADLLARLSKKQKLYEPNPWTGGQD